jgi:DNA-binding CsgD family transcriptional regulator
MGRIKQIQIQSKPELTDREKILIKMIVDEKTNKEIAVELGLSIRTVENHRYRMMKKLNLRSTAGVVKMALREGLV